MTPKKCFYLRVRTAVARVEAAVRRVAGKRFLPFVHARWGNMLLQYTLASYARNDVSARACGAAFMSTTRVCVTAARTRMYACDTPVCQVVYPRHTRHLTSHTNCVTACNETQSTQAHSALLSHHQRARRVRRGGRSYRCGLGRVLTSAVISADAAAM